MRINVQLAAYELYPAMEGYVPGKQLSGGAYIKLNTNENPYPPSPRVLAALREAVGADLRCIPTRWRCVCGRRVQSCMAVKWMRSLQGMVPMIF